MQQNVKARKFIILLYLDSVVKYVMYHIKSVLVVATEECLVYYRDHISWLDIKGLNYIKACPCRTIKTDLYYLVPHDYIMFSNILQI